MMSKRTPLGFLGYLVLTCLLSASSPSNADGAFTGATCAPADYAMWYNRYTITAGKMNHAGTNVDLISFYCPITRSFGTISNITMRYWDSDGTSTGTFVAAQLWRMDRTNGNIVNLGTFNSNSFSSTNLTTNNQPITSVTFDSLNYVYYIRIDMDRANASDISQWNWVKLQ